MTRLRHLVDQIATVGSDGHLPFVALEHLESGTGGFTADAVIEDKEADPAGMVEFSSGDVMFGKLRPYLRKSWLADRAGLCSSELIVMRPRPGKADSRWLAYAVQTQQFVDWAVASSEGVKMPRTSWEKLGLYELELLPVVAQRAIAEFLDAETNQIDELTRLRLEQCRLLEARLSALIEATVLGLSGARTTGTYFSSRPVHWRESQLRHFGAAVQTGPFGSQLHAEDYVEGGTPVINPVHLVNGEIVPNDSVTVDEWTRSRLSRHLLAAGDIVVGRRGELGRVAVVDEKSSGFLCGTGCLRVRSALNSLRPGYLALLLASAPLRAYFEIASVGSTMDNLSAETLLNAPVLVPDLSEQAAIEAAVTDASLQIKQARSAMVKQVSLMNERRQALISAAVAGQIEIPGVAA
jgi:type I restriction enzyme, S subunit